MPTLTAIRPPMTTTPPPITDGLLVVDKPAGWTSHDVVGRVRRLCRTRKVGHAGTLDPMATGVLVLGVGRATRLLTYLVGCDKAYAATVRLGQATLTDDAEGEVIDAAGVDVDVVLRGLPEAVAALTGAILQRPSAVSAIKVAGERAYARVRAGEQVDLPARPVRVTRFEVVGHRAEVVDSLPVLDVDIEVEVSSGTYVRALARDLGQALGCGGHLTSLRRTRVGTLDLAQAHPLEELTAVEAAGGVQPLVPLAEAAAATFPSRELNPDDARKVSMGQRIASERPGRSGPVAALSPDGVLVALLDEEASTARSLVVFAPAAS